MRTLASWSLPLLLLMPRPQAAETARYYIAFLRPAPDRTAISPADAERIQTAHMANIDGMVTRGVLVAAGPFDDRPTTISGIFVFALGSAEEAQRLADADPTVVEHRNVVDIVTWDGPASIRVNYARFHAAHPDAPVDMGVYPLFMVYASNTTSAGGVSGAEATYLENLRTSGKIAAWGPASGGTSLRAIVVFNRIADEEAQRSMAADPAEANGSVRAEFHRWWCAAHVLPEK